MPETKPSRAKTSSTTSQHDKDQGEETTKCGRCDKEVAENKDKALQCELCDLWFHISCQAVCDSLYEVIRDERLKATPLVSWYCIPSCRRTADKFLKGARQLQADVDKLQKDMEGTRSKVDKMAKGDFTAGMKAAITKISSQSGSAQTEKLQQEIVGMREKMEKLESGEIPRGMAGYIQVAGRIPPPRRSSGHD